MTATENNTAWQSVAMSGGAPVSIDFDYNCDGTEEKQELDTYSDIASCSSLVIGGASGLGIGGASSFDTPSAVGGFGGVGGFVPFCNGENGWVGGIIPPCGTAANYSTCYYSSALAKCTRKTTSVPQSCR
jgi:hypothetical protein